MTGVLPASSHRGRALQKDLAELGVAASCEPADLWAMSRDCWPRTLLWTKAGLTPRQVLMHPGPVNRGVELSGEVLESPQAVISAQVEAGVVVRMAVLYELLAGAGAPVPRRRAGIAASATPASAGTAEAATAEIAEGVGQPLPGGERGR